MTAHSAAPAAPDEPRTGPSAPPLPARISEVLRSIIRWAAELMRADAGEIFVWDPEQGVLVQAISFGFVEAYNGVTLRPGEGLGGKVYQSGEPMIIPDYASWEGRSERYSPVPAFTGTFAVPLKWNERIVGVLSMDADSRRRAFGPNDIHLATLFANVATLAIQNARLYDDLQERSQALQRTLEREVAERTAELAHRALQLETSARVSREITAILELDGLVHRVVELIRESFGYYCVLVFLWDGETNRLVLRAAGGAPAQRLAAQGLSLPLEGRSLNSRAVRSNEAVLVNDVSTDRDFQAVDLIPGVCSELILPLRVGKQVVGTLDVQSDRLHAFQPDDLLVIQSLGDQLAIAIENARLYDRSRELAILEERTRLARELHDSVAQSLFSIDLSAKAASTYLGSDRQRATAELAELRHTAHNALLEMRTMIYNLRPVSLKDAGLAAALRREIDQQRRPGGPQLVLETSGCGALPLRLEMDLLRIAQEALRNAIKHAQAQTITVTVTQQAGGVDLCVADDGRGFDPEMLTADGRRSFGLLGVRERVKLLDGSLEIASRPGAGTQVRVHVPVPAGG